jgi:2-methylcitrate dehydratase PrpD
MPTITDDAVHHFAEAAATADFDHLPAAAIDAAKKSLLDTLGVMLAASGTEPAVRAAIDLATEAGGKPEASIVAFGHRTSAISAAFANGALAHSLDFDDQTPWGQHASSTVVPAVLAVAERRGGVPGRDMIAAVAVGQDLFARLRCNVGWRKDRNLSTVLGVFAGAAAAGRVRNSCIIAA